MKPVSRLWLVLLVCIIASGSTSACITRLGRAITGGAAEPGLFPLVGRIVGALAGNKNGYAGTGVPLSGNQYGPYAGQYQGNYPAYNQQPLGSTYYPNQQQPLGSTYYPNQQQPLGSTNYLNQQQPLGSTYYPNQQPGLNVQMQPATQPYYSGQPVQTNLSPQPIVSGATYQPAATNALPVQPVTTSNVQAGIPPRYIRR